MLHDFSCVHSLLQVFSVYECRSAAAQHGKEHPGDIAEPASLAAIPLPPRCSGCRLAGHLRGQGHAGRAHAWQQMRSMLSAVLSRKRSCVAPCHPLQRLPALGCAGRSGVCRQAELPAGAVSSHWSLAPWSMDTSCIYVLHAWHAGAALCWRAVPCTKTSPHATSHPSMNMSRHAASHPPPLAHPSAAGGRAVRVQQAPDLAAIGGALRLLHRCAPACCYPCTARLTQSLCACHFLHSRLPPRTPAV